MKKIFVIFLPIVFTFLGLLLGFMVHYRNDNNIPSAKTEVIKKSRSLSMMLETGAGTGVYETTTRSTWPTDGYLFNEELSKCENGGKLSWNDENNTVVMTGSTSDKCYVYFDKVTFLADHIKSKYTGTQGGNGIYLHNSSLANGAGDNSYRYAGGDYVLTSKATNAGLTKVITTNSSETNGIINFYCNGTKQYDGYYCSSSYTHYYKLQYDSSNTQYQTYKQVLAKAIEDGYVKDDNIKNYVCFGSIEPICPADNLYRIIGVFGDQVKLIKWDFANSNILGTNGAYSYEDNYTPSSTSTYIGSLTTINGYKWNRNGSNTWSESDLNTINLNTNYITYLNNQNSKWVQKIATTTWKVGGNTWENILYIAINTLYQNEILSPVEPTTYSAKIGLMYASDYGYTSSPNTWTTPLDYSSSRTRENWMYMQSYEWTITRESNETTGAFYVGGENHFNLGSVSGIDPGGCGIRPTFYLNSNVVYDKGSGTSSDPYRIKL